MTSPTDQPITSAAARFADTGRCPMRHEQINDAYFMANRAKLLDIAAFLDRLDRAADAPQPDDFRMRAFREAIAILSTPGPDRARRVLEALSDPTSDPIATAPGKGAAGAFPG